MNRRAVLSGLAAAPLACAAAATAQTAPEPPAALIYYGGEAGRLTIDRDHRGGNPFASAFVDVLADPDLTLGSFGERLAFLTNRYANGWQRPQLPRSAEPAGWRVGGGLQHGDEGDRLALVLINADYSASGAPSLTGARHDADRVTEALCQAGYLTQLVLDASASEARAELANFADVSRGAEGAVIYIGGHGVQNRRTVWWMMGDYPRPDSAEALPTHAISIPEIAQAAQARLANLVLYASCRNDPFR